MLRASPPRPAAARDPCDIEELAGRSNARQALLDWYDRGHRVLPWRRNEHSRRAPAQPPAEGWPRAPGCGAPLATLSRADFAYGVWVSEVMLQQTQVDRVAEYFCRWMARWPTLRALAAADDEEVNAAWSGLGYYRRARFLLQGARYAVAHTGGELPSTASALLKVPGVGAYTAAAVSSIAFGEAAAAVDGNVVRVLSRLHALAQANPASSAAVKQMQALADALMRAGPSHPHRPGDWNQAVMELGATVCTPRAPRCDACPVAGCCGALQRVRAHAAAAAGDAAGAGAPPAVTDFPTRVAKAQRRAESVAVRVVEWTDAGATPPARWLLMLRRPDGGLLGGQWEFPSAVSSPEASETSRRAALDATLTALGLPQACGAGAQPVGDVVHVFSHIEHTMAVERVALTGGEPPALRQVDGEAPTWRWVAQPADGSPPAGMTGGVRKAWAALQPPAAAKQRKKAKTGAS